MLFIIVKFAESNNILQHITQHILKNCALCKKYQGPTESAHYSKCVLATPFDYLKCASNWDEFNLILKNKNQSALLVCINIAYNINFEKKVYTWNDLHFVLYSVERLWIFLKMRVTDLSLSENQEKVKSIDVFQ